MSISTLGTNNLVSGLASTVAVPPTPPSSIGATQAAQTNSIATQHGSGGHGNSALLKALQQTLAQYGLTASGTAATTGTASTAAAASTTAATATTAAASTNTTQNSTQALQAFLGALFQALTQAQGTPAAASATAGTGTGTGTADTGTSTTVEIVAVVQSDTQTGSNTGDNNNGANNGAGANSQQASQYSNATSGNLSALLQELQSGSSNTASANTTGTGTSGTGTLAALQADFENLLNTASAGSSQATANAVAPTLQSFVQTLAQNFASDTGSAATKTNAIGGLVETTA